MSPSLARLVEANIRNWFGENTFLAQPETPSLAIAALGVTHPPPREPGVIHRLRRFVCGSVKSVQSVDWQSSEEKRKEGKRIGFPLSGRWRPWAGSWGRTPGSG